MSFHLQALLWLIPILLPKMGRKRNKIPRGESLTTSLQDNNRGDGWPESWNFREIRCSFPKPNPPDSIAMYPDRMGKKGNNCEKGMDSLGKRSADRPPGVFGGDPRPNGGLPG
jgi:hypothetical protein